MAEKTNWILVCDAARARIYQSYGRRGAYQLVHEVDHPEGRERELDLVSDTSGRKPVGPSRDVRPGPGLGYGRPGAAPSTDRWRIEAEGFARSLVELLEAGRIHRRFEACILVAPPQFLGMLNAQLGSELRRCVELTIDKDLSMLDERLLLERIQAHRELQPPAVV